MDPIGSNTPFNLRAESANIDQATQATATAQPSMPASSLNFSSLSSHAISSLKSLESQGNNSEQQLARLTKDAIQGDYLRLSSNQQQTRIVQYERQEKNGTLTIKAKLNESYEYDILAVKLCRASGEPLSINLPGPRLELASTTQERKSYKARVSLLNLSNKFQLQTQISTKRKEERNGRPRQDSERSLKEFYKKLSATDKVTVVVGGGTAALTYLATKRFDEADTHILVLGTAGYWGDKVAHRLAQPHHIFALPHQESAGFIDPSEHDKRNGLLPHDTSSAYVHSRSYQSRLAELEEITLDSLRRQGKEIHIESGVLTQNIFKKDGKFRLKLDVSDDSFFADKMVVATGAAPGRKLPAELTPKHIGTALSGQTDTGDHILSYSDILTSSTAEKIRDKDVFIYGGGATAAWAMEVADRIGNSTTWVARNGFDNAEEAGPRVEAIIEGSRDSQVKGRITSIEYLHMPFDSSEQKKIRINVAQDDPDGTNKTAFFIVDYLVNCIGQDAYEEGGLHDILSSDIKDDLIPIFDRNRMSGKSGTTLGFSTMVGDLEIIGAAAASYYDIERDLKPGPAVSASLPRSAKVPITIGGVVSSVSALTGYMPISQDRASGEIALSALNMHVMNATQLAVYFTGLYPMATAEVINNSVEQYLAQRSETEFGLTDKQTRDFMVFHFEANLENEKAH